MAQRKKKLCKYILLSHPIYIYVVCVRACVRACVRRARARIHRATGSSHPQTSARTAYTYKYPIQAHKAHAYIHTRNDAERQRKSPSDQQCGNSERLRVTLCESRTTRAATNDLLISLSVRARSSCCTNFPERRNRTVGEPSPDVLRIGLTLPLFPISRSYHAANATAIRSP